MRLLLLALCLIGPLRAQSPMASVPFVGCKSDGQVGPQDAPEGKSKLLPIAAEDARKLAYYSSGQGLHVLGPRGWYCFGTYGSGGATLFITSGPIDTARIFAPGWHVSGAAVEISDFDGDTSGRMSVAEIIARVFPQHRAFVENVRKMFDDLDLKFPSGPYPSDTLTRKGGTVVEYETPPRTEGLGTYSQLPSNGDTIRGVAILTGDAPDAVLLAVRLPGDLAALAPVIVRQVERETPPYRGK